MKATTARTSVLGRVGGAIACDAFCSLDDGVYHAVVLAEDGGLVDVAYDRTGASRGIRTIGSAPGARDVTAFWSHVDDVRSVIAVAESGEVWHFSQKESGPWSRLRRREVPGALRIAGYDEHHHGIVLTDKGEISDQPFHALSTVVRDTFKATTTAQLERLGQSAPSAAIDESVPADGSEEAPIAIGESRSAVDIAALWADADSRFVILAEADGAISEIGYGIYQTESRRELARIAGVRRISACYVDDPATGRRIVALTDAGDVHVLGYGRELPEIGQPVLSMAADDMACFRTLEAELRIVLLVGDEAIEVSGLST